MNARELEAALRQGAVFYMRHRHVGDGREPHFCIVMNAAPDSDEVLILTVISSKTDLTVKRVLKMKLPSETLVRITPSDYAPLKVDSVVNCNDPKRDTLFSLCAEADAGRIKVCTPIPSGILCQIIAGMKASRLVSPAYKKMLDPKPTPPAAR